MTQFLKDSGYDENTPVHVVSDGAKDLIGVAQFLPHQSSWLLDWADIGRLIHRLGQGVERYAYGRVTPNGSAFELWDHFVCFRSHVGTGDVKRWTRLGAELYELFDIRGEAEPSLRHAMTEAQSRLLDILNCLEVNKSALVDYCRWQQEGRRISTGFVESTINRLIGRRLCKGQQMRWTRAGAHAVLQVRAAILNDEFEARASAMHPWIGKRRITWPSDTASQPF